ncbi:hypothetical protein Tco_0771052 [Tanacetum coccineum]|uniref:Uncharacterized protein n=1 Tax=Tanacetum coccineum TaxID=301880 RepID=A0ABQ4ZF95_9ASTR
MSRTNSQVEIVSEEQLVPRTNRLVIKKNNQRVASDSHITDTMLRFVVDILRHHKLYKPVSLTATVPIIYLHQFWTTINHNANNHTFTFELDTHTFTLTHRLLRIVLQMSPPDPNNTYTKPPSENQILGFIKTLGYDEDPETKMIVVSKMVATRLHQPWRAILSVLNRSLTGKDSSWDTDEFEWQTVERSSRQSKMSKLFAQDDQPITKLSNTVKGDDKFGMEIPDIMISDAIKKVAEYKFYMAKKVESENAKTVDELEEQHIDVVPRKTRSLAIAKEIVIGELANSISIQGPRTRQRQRSQLTIHSQIDDAIGDTYVEWGQELKGHIVKDPTVQSLVDVSSHLLSCAYVIEVYTKSKKEYESHLKMNLELLKKEKCHVKPNKVEAKNLIMEEAACDDVFCFVPGMHYEKIYMMELLANGCSREHLRRHRVRVSSIPDKDGMYIEVLGKGYVGRWLIGGDRRSKRIGLELEQETTKVVVIKERLKKAKDR